MKDRDTGNTKKKKEFPRSSHSNEVDKLNSSNLIDIRQLSMEGGKEGAEKTGHRKNLVLSLEVGIAELLLEG